MKTKGRRQSSNYIDVRDERKKDTYNSKQILSDKQMARARGSLEETPGDYDYNMGRNDVLDVVGREFTGRRDKNPAPGKFTKPEKPARKKAPSAKKATKAAPAKASGGWTQVTPGAWETKYSKVAPPVKLKGVKIPK